MRVGVNNAECPQTFSYVLATYTKFDLLIDAKHHGASLTERYDVTWMSNSACASDQRRAASFHAN